jgi:hypothetical protein
VIDQFQERFEDRPRDKAAWVESWEALETLREDSFNQNRDLSTKSELWNRLEKTLASQFWIPSGEFLEKCRFMARAFLPFTKSQFHVATQGPRGIWISSQMALPLTEIAIHAIRNSLAHAGKAESLQLKITLELKGASLHLSFEDNGTGPDWKKIETLARKKKLVKAAELSRGELLQLLFHSKFTTGKKHALLSGAGMGLFAIRSLVERMGGSCEIGTHEGDKKASGKAPQGFILNLKIPLQEALLEIAPLNASQRDQSIVTYHLSDSDTSRLCLFRRLGSGWAHAWGSAGQVLGAAPSQVELKKKFEEQKGEMLVWIHPVLQTVGILD